MKMTKKIISVLLAVMMVITMLPMSVFAATQNSKDDQVAVNAQAAIAAYENKMDGTIYKNMQAAYDAYINVVKSYNVYVYGDYDNGLAGYTQTLIDTTNAMTTEGIYDWSAYSGVESVIPTFNGNTISDTNLYGNIVNTSTCTTSYDGRTDGSDISGQAVAFDQKAKTDVVIFHPEVVTVYDGKNNIVVPVMAGLKKRENKERRVLTVYPTAETGTNPRPADHPFFKSLYLTTGNDDYSFKGAESQNSMDFNSARGKGSKMGCARNNNGHYSDSCGNVGLTWFYWGWYATAFQITDDINFGTAGYMNFKPNWYWVGDSGTTNASDVEYVDNNMFGNKTSTKSIHILNLKGMLDLYADAKTKATNYSLYIEQYRNDTPGASLSDFFKGMDAVTSLTLSDITGATTSTVETVGAKLSTAITYLPSSGTPLEGAGYAALRDAMENTRTTYNAANSEKYTAEAWNGFVTAYDNAKSFMKESMTAGYYDDQAQALATALNQALKTLNDSLVFSPADISILKVLMDDAIVAVVNKDSFTAASLTASNIEANINQCKIDIWTNGEYGEIGGECGIDRQDDVDAWVIVISDSIKALEIDLNAEVGSAYGYSMNSAIEEAGKLTPADYGNYGDLYDALEAAQKFDPRMITDTMDSSNLPDDLVSAKLNEYIELTRNIVTALKSLVPSFIKMPDGQVVKSVANTVAFTTGANHSDGKYYRVSYNYPTDVVLFRTEHGAKTLQLPDSTIGFYATSTGESKMGPSYMDSINIDSNITNEEPEITSKKDNEDHSMENPGAYQGKLTKSATVNGITYTLTLGNNAALTGVNSGIFGKTMTNVGNYGRDLNGNDVTDSAFDWSDSLRNTSGTSAGKVGPIGSLIANYGWTYVTATTSMNLPARNVARPAMTTIPVAENTNFSAVIRWNYPGAANRVYYGYGTNSTQYSQTVYAIDVAGLIDLINECLQLQRANYTTTSWNAFYDARNEAMENIDYDNNTPADILTECQRRFDNLRDYRDLLVEAANNNSIDEALAQAREIKEAVDNGEKRYSTSTYEAFLDARQNALDAVNGIYSDENCLDLIKTDMQATIDAIADALLEAIANLATFADFTDLNSVLATVLADKTFTVDTLNEFNSFIASLTYANMSAEEKNEVEADYQSAVDAETLAITNKINSLVVSVAADKTAFDAAAQTLANADPDAYNNIEACLEVIDEYKANDYAKLLYTTVNVLGHNVVALNPQQVVDTAVSRALSLTLQQYKVYVDGAEYATYDFGQEAEVKFAKNSAIYYAYKSNTNSNVPKYYTTDSIIRFIVKGDTYLTTKAAENTETAKVTFINALRNKTYETDYVVKGSQLTLPEAPSIAYYDFVGYTVNGADYQAGDAVTVSKNTSVVANYEFTSDLLDLTIYFNRNGTGTLTNLYNRVAIYNDLVEITEAGLKNYQKHTGSKYYGSKFLVEGTEIMKPSDRDPIYMKTTDPVYAYATIDYTIEDEFFDMYSEFIIEDEYDGSISYSDSTADFAGALKVVNYGPDYSFYASGDTVIYALTEEDYTHAVAAGLIDADQNGADVSVKSELVDADTKWSMIGTYAIPQGATLIENGILFTKNGSDLKMSNVDGQNVYRFKSSQHTIGNQFVISVKKPATATDTKYVAYTIYELGGKQYTVFSDTVTNVMAPRA